MKKLLFYLGVLFGPATLFAQRELGSLQSDSLPLLAPDRSFETAPVHVKPGMTNAQRFEAANPGAKLVTHTRQGTVYSMTPDNMAVLVPKSDQTERMPCRRGLTPGPDKMPN